MENQPNEICSHLTERASKGRFLTPENGSKITVTKEKERRKRKSEEIRKGGEEKKAMVALLVFIIATLEIVFGRKKLLDAKGPFGDNVFKNPARYMCSAIYKNIKWPIVVHRD